MAREILFKAKRKDNGEWVEGYYQKRYDEIGRERHYIFLCESHIVWEYAEIDINTLCQFTGLTDKNGNKIWENDVVNLKFRDGRIGSVEKEYKYVVRYDEQEASYELEGNLDLLGYPCFIRNNQYMFEVIGNIFDNPELLGGGE